jgi:hypothetical protein
VNRLFDVIGRQDVVVAALVIGGLGRRLVGTPSAVNDKLEIELIRIALYALGRRDG